eukprot:CAMPEP_0196584758 /NCGR_PEP_ID=MMETSP1081-20130531/48359_1 /TAXON_ID=36882 /ORGANISM="Pyramimonas amylifera, Strain CCMP720" /LENGTH=966 /DNA_ID=CAMNT_0041906085 /DNA_START=496 /DNA_END=3396 /DNA_ORIENTATION=-
MNPATFLRVLGPEPWRVCYPEPSIRPDDSRYGDNPNRVQRHTQFQVILKPDPSNAQELYLGSLEALGIDTGAHDVRFVEDNWESPVLGAWGLGWEVWLDGMEVTQFTYFQQSGGEPLEQIAVEITYGLERILMNLQGVKHFKDIRYSDNLTYGELFLQNEYEMSCFNMDEASVQSHRMAFDLSNAEATRLLEQRLPVPAYDQLLKTSHAFNILDARGAVGVTERATLFGMMRKLARECSSLWLERRRELEFPLGLTPEHVMQEPVTGGVLPSSPTTLVLEVGVEELPAADVLAARDQLKMEIPALLHELRLRHAEVIVGGTPRRLSVEVRKLAAMQEDKEEKLRGPPSKVAFDNEGNPTKAALGFCKKNGISMEDVTREEDDKGTEYLYAVVHEKGQPAGEVLASALPALLSSLSFPKSMRWQDTTYFSRPVRTLLALHGEFRIPITALGVAGAPVTRLLRNHATPIVEVPSADDYASIISSSGIVLDIEDRKAAILEGVKALVAEVGGAIPLSSESDLLDEVACLVESPNPVLGEFDPDFLSLPREVLVMVMRKHQRYFPVEDPETGDLLPYFVTVANGPIDATLVREGNEAVLRARYEDARFFYKQDLRRDLLDFAPLLEGITFERSLGSMLDKSGRVESLVEPIGVLMAIEFNHIERAKEAAKLYRCDLASAMVMEFTALAGVMGKHYAQLQGQVPPVCEAILEAALPRFADDDLPGTQPGQVVAVADRLDSLVGLFAVGCAPSSSADPFGLRRIAYGLVQTLVACKTPINLPKAIHAAAQVQPVEVSEEVQREALVFVTRRLEQLLVDNGNSVEGVRAILNARGDNPSLAFTSVEALQEELGGERLSTVMTALARPTRLMRGKESQAGEEEDLNPDLMGPEELALFHAYADVRSKLQETWSGMAIQPFLECCEVLAEPVDAFFENVFVMDENLELRKNRLTLLKCVADLPTGIMDLSELPGF